MRRQRWFRVPIYIPALSKSRAGPGFFSPKKSYKRYTPISLALLPSHISRLWRGPRTPRISCSRRAGNHLTHGALRPNGNELSHTEEKIAQTPPNRRGRTDFTLGISS